MSYIYPESRHQLIMPFCIDDYVSKDNPVRFIDAFVDKMVEIQPELLSEKGTKHIGRSAYQFSTLFKLYIYGFLNSISSSRKLEQETHRNLEVIWLLGNLRLSVPIIKRLAIFVKTIKNVSVQLLFHFVSF